MRHTDGHRHQCCRNAGHFSLALGPIGRFQSQIAGSGTNGTIACRYTGITFGSNTNITHAYTCQTCGYLYGTGMDCFFVVRNFLSVLHISLAGRHGHTAAFDLGILYRNVIQFVQVVDHIRHVH